MFLPGTFIAERLDNAFSCPCLAQPIDYPFIDAAFREVLLLRQASDAAR
jgi:hypothetical protein